MNHQSIQKIRNDFDRIAIHEQVGWNHNHCYHKFLLKQLPLHCENVLDIGCGTSAFSCLLAENTSSSHQQQKQHGKSIFLQIHT